MNNQRNYLEEYLSLILKQMKSKTLTDDDIEIHTNGISDIIQVVAKTDTFSNVNTDGSISVRVNYGCIAEYVYNNELSAPFQRIEEIDGHLNFLKELLDSHSNNFSDIEKEKSEAFFRKVHNHISLSIKQKKFILNAAGSALKTANKADKAAKEAKNHLKSMYANFITILGIFTAIIITLAGGISIISSSLDFLKDPILFVFFVSVSMLCMFSIMHFLFSWINKVRAIKEDNQNKPILYIEWIFLAVIVIAAISGNVATFSHLNQQNKISDTNKISSQQNK